MSAKKVSRKKTPSISIIMGSESDFPTMKPGLEVLKRFGIPWEIEVVSAHRTPERMYRYATQASARGIKVIIAAAGGAAHLPGMVASLTVLPVIGVPVESSKLKGLDSLLSIAQMPPGVPVATMAIGNSINAVLFALQILALEVPAINKKLLAFRNSQKNKVKKMNQSVGRARKTSSKHKS
ncbi:MAG: 5-(carboxyamino)imidazole ribonucleotide mutase [Bdellovibrionota bacterium]